MENHLIEILEQLIERLSRDGLRSSEEDYRQYLQIERLYEDAMRRLFPEQYGYLGRRNGGVVELHEHLNRLERKLNRLHPGEQAVCYFSQDGAERFPQFLTALNDVKAQSDGKSGFVGHFKDWFSTHKRGVIVDPYIFTSANENESDYCKGVVEILGGELERIDFYYSAKDFVPSIAQKICTDLIKSKDRDFNFYACPNIHDRVWLRHYQVTDTPKADAWEARVVGASVNGICIRPTYVVDMLPEDAKNYSKYLGNLRNGVAGIDPISASKSPPT
jgi:hypothetical protein